MRGAGLFAGVLLLTALPAFGQANLLSNPGFEIGYNGQRMMDSINSWTPETYPAWDWGRIRNAAGAATATYAGTNMFQFDAFANYNKVMSQPWAATAGRIYEVDGWMKSPAGANYFRPTNGFCYVKIQFFNSAGTSLGSEECITKFRQNGPTNWAQFTTGPVLAPAGSVTGKALFGYCPGGDDWAGGGDLTTSGYVYQDDLRAFTNAVPFAGALSNHSFEVRSCAYLPLTNMVWWEGFGTDGGIVTNFRRTGNLSLQIWGVDSLGGQKWPATRSNKYYTSAYLFSSNFTTTNAYGLVILQFLDGTGTNVLQEYQSPHFTSLSPSNTWTNFTAVGVAPNGTVYGRTMLGIVGDVTGFGSSGVWFDDATQSVMAATTTVSGLIRNVGFDDGPAGNAYNLETTNDLPWWDWMGGTNAGYVNQAFQYTAEQSLSITYPGNSIGQNFASTASYSYVVEGYVYNPASEQLAGSAYGTLTVEFYKGTNLISTYDGAHFTTGTSTNTWIKFGVTNRAPWSGTVTGKVLCSINGDPSGFAGALYFDALRVTQTNIALSDSQGGALWNYGFEYTAPGTLLARMEDKWVPIGNQGTIMDTVQRTGRNGLKLTGPDSGLQQDWVATQGWRYASAAYAYTPSADKFAGTNVHAVVQLQFLDTGSNVLATYESAYFMTNATAGTWSNLAAEGVAPVNTKYGRTIVGLFGDPVMSGSIWFDDATQRVVSTTGTVSGLLFNPGFEDGPPGNAYNLDATNDLPSWDWLGGTNAGFITTAYKYSGGQSLAITYPSNMIAQSMLVVTGYTYVFEGYMYTPASEKFTNAAYGVLMMEFYQSNSLVSVVESEHFTTSYPSNTWIKFAVTNRAPWFGGAVTCRVLCAVMGSTIGYNGSVYFDGLSVTGSYVGLTNKQAGALWNPGFEYTSRGTVLGRVDSWTALGNSGSIADTYKRTGNNALRIYGPETMLAQTWTATAGWKYATAAWAYTPSADRLAGSTNLHGVVLMEFYDVTGTNQLISYQSPWFRTNFAAGAWTNLEVIGVAPAGTVYGRTVLGLLGTNTGFGGSLYFDDATQRVVATTGTVSGLLRNPGFDDGPSGNASNLQAVGDLPYWQWLGGGSAGFVSRDYFSDNQQSFVITYPLNLVKQDWTASGGTAYKAEGYLFTPASAKFNTDGKSFGRLEMSFYVNGSTTAYSSATAYSPPFGASQPSNTWVYFAVTGFAPYASIVTGRLSCIIACTDDPAEDTLLSGVIHFDQLTLNSAVLTSDVRVAVSDAPDPIRVGYNLTYSIAVTNAGPHQAGNVSVVDVLPTNVNFLSCTLSQGTYTQEDNTVTCDLGSLARGATAAVSIVVWPSEESVITNEVTISTSCTDPVTANNRAACTTTVQNLNRPPEIILPGPHTLAVGSSTSFVVYAQDPDHDPGLTITNTVKPSGATYVNSNFTWTATPGFCGTTNPLVFVANDGTGETNSVVTNSTFIVVQYDSDADGLSDGWEWLNFTSLVQNGAGDWDSDGANNDHEFIAGTQPTNNQSYFFVWNVTTPLGSSNHLVRGGTEPGRRYTIYFTDQRLSNEVPWTTFANTNWGVWIQTGGSSTNHTFTDDEGTNTTGSKTSSQRLYKVKVKKI